MADTVPDLQKISRLGRIGATVSLLALLFMLLTTLWTFRTPAKFLETMQREMTVITGQQNNVRPVIAISIAASILMQMLVGCGMLWLSRNLFLGFARGEILTPATGRRIERLGWLIAAIFPISQIVTALSVAAVYLFWPEGQHSIHWIGLFALVFTAREENGVVAGQVAFSFGGLELAALVCGGLIILIGRIFAEAARISEENKAFV